MQTLIRDLNRLYRDTLALHEVDFSDSGFEWIDWNDRDNSVFSWIRRDKHGGFVVCVTNLTPIVRDDYRLAVPQGGEYRVLLNSDSEYYGGSGVGPAHVWAEAIEHHGRTHSARLTLPPLATLILGPRQ